MKRLTKDHVCYRMSRDNAPAITVALGEPISIEAEDCYSGNLRTEDDVFTKDMWDTVNPATGPVYVEGAEPGGVLRVEIERIDTRDYAVMCVERGAGALADFIEGVETRILPIAGGRLRVSDRLSLPVRPMIGVIGVAPEGDPILNGAPGEHGGNMDCARITAGVSLYLPIYTEGALLSLGDIHAVMGDGEVCICGAEVSGDVTLRAFPISSDIPTPCVETPDDLLFIASALTLDACEKLVLAKAHRYLTGPRGLSPNDAARLMSLAGDLGVCQVVDPLKTMKFTFPREILEGL